MFYFYDELILQINICLVVLGTIGIFVNRLNILISIICIELMFYGINMSLVTGGLTIGDLLGQAAALFVITAAASESAIALALILTYFRVFKDILLEDL